MIKYPQSRVTVCIIEDHIEHEFYINVGDSIDNALKEEAEVNGKHQYPGVPESLFNMTKCILVLKNGFVVSGESACADSRFFDQAIGERVAREDAIRKIWPLLGYELRELLHQKDLSDASES